MFYESFIFPWSTHTHLTYGIIVWGATIKSYLSPLTLLQNKAVKIAANAKWFESPYPIFKLYNIFPLDKLPDFETAKFMHLYINNKIPKTI